MKNKIDISTQHYFPYHFIVLGIVFLLMSLLLSLMHPIIAVILFLLGVIFTSTHYRLTIDTDHKRYKEYLWIFGLKNGRELPYKKVEYVYFSKIERHSEFGFVARLSARKTVYQGYLRLSDDETIYIGECSNEKAILKKGKKISDTLKVDTRKNY